MKLAILVLATSLVIMLCGCGFQNNTDAQFGDQHFKTAISLIELHKVRTGSYPQTLSELKFTGAWDQIALASVAYSKLNDGYELNVVRGWIAKPELSYPAEFWVGLGLKASNAKRGPDTTASRAQ